MPLICRATMFRSVAESGIATGTLLLGLAGAIAAVAVLRRRARVHQGEPLPVVPAWGQSLEDALIDGVELLNYCLTAPILPRPAYSIWMGTTEVLVCVHAGRDQHRRFYSMEGLTPPDAPLNWSPDEARDCRVLWCRVERLREIRAAST